RDHRRTPQGHAYRPAAVRPRRPAHADVTAKRRDPTRCAVRLSPGETRMKGKKARRPGLLQRLAKGPGVCAQGHRFELGRRGDLQAGAFVPEVLLEHPEVVERLHRDFVHAGSDVVEACTYYVHREKLRVIGREKDLEPMNAVALKIARKVARETGALFAG